MSRIVFALLAIHGGAVYELDSNLTDEDCARLLAPGAVTFFEAAPNVQIKPDATTRFECVARMPDGYPVPQTNPKFEDLGAEPVPTRIHAYPGTWGAPSDATALLLNGKGKTARRKLEVESWSIVPRDQWAKPDKKSKRGRKPKDD